MADRKVLLTLERDPYIDSDGGLRIDARFRKVIEPGGGATEFRGSTTFGNVLGDQPLTDDLVQAILDWALDTAVGYGFEAFFGISSGDLIVFQHGMTVATIEYTNP